MNRIYRLVWSHNAGCMVPVAETAMSKVGGKAKSCRRGALLAAAIMIIGGQGTAFADDVTWSQAYPSYLFPTTPGYNFDQVIDTGYAFSIDGQPLSKHYAAGTTLNILGAIPQFPDFTSGTHGVSGTSVQVINALPDASGPDAGRIITLSSTDSNGLTQPITSANIGQFTYSPNPANPQQNEELNVVVPGLEGSYQIISTYDSSTFVSADDAAVGSMLLPVYDPNSVRILNAFGIVSVGSVGGTANVDIGASTIGTTPIAAAANTLDLLAKNSVLAKADGSAGNASTVNWLSDNYIHFRPAAVVSTQQQSVTQQSTQYNYSLTLPNYVATGDGTNHAVQLGTKTFDIQSSADIADVNDYLTGQGAYAGKPQIQYWLTAGAMVNGQTIDSTVRAQNTYNGIITGLLQKADNTSINLTYAVWDDQGAHTNNATLGTGDLNVIYATGANATGTVTSTGSLAVDGASAVMRADNGAVITNNGAINAWRSSGSSPLPAGMLATNATAVNNGVLNAGLFLEKDGSNQNVNNAGSVAMSGLGASTLTNNGYINVAVTDTATALATGINAAGTTTATNLAGASIALVGNSNNANGKAGGHAVSVQDAATFSNFGAITVGTSPVTSTTPASAVNMAGSGALTAGIYSTTSGSITNAASGAISLLIDTRNAAGIFSNGGSGSITNDGAINVLGQLTAGSAAANYGMYIQDNAGVATNNGAIYVNGDNNIALNVLALTTNASLSSTSSGSIIVGAAGDTGGSDGQPYTYRNYAVYAEGLNGNAAQVQLDSSIRLLSAGAIGVHARGDATINVGTPASLSLENSQQIGYYAYGQGASINIANAQIDDNAQTGSILFAVDGGATFNGTAGSASNYVLNVRGNKSTGIFANGVDDMNTPDQSDDVATVITTGNAKINVSGQNAVGVKISGGATGNISNGAITLEGNDATAVQIDGRNYNIDATIDPVPRVTTVLSDANIGSVAGQSGIVGYDVAYQGALTLNAGADINLQGSGSTGVLLHNNGSAIINSNVAVDGTGNIGVDIQNAGTLTNNGAISVSGAAGSGNVGLRVAGAGAVVTQLGTVTANGGLAAVQLTGSGASLTVNGAGNQITAANGADGVRIDSTGASSFNAANTTINVTGTGSGINNNADSSNINLNAVTINAGDGPAIRTAVTFNAEGTGNILNVNGNVSGSGFAFMKADGTLTTGNLTIGNGYTINGNGANSVGILARTSGNVTSGTHITMAATAGAAIEATNAQSLTNNGTIGTSSDTGSTILAENTSAFTNNGIISSSSTSNINALIALNGTAANRTINNTGSVISQSQSATVIDASGAGNNTLNNTGTLKAASSSAQVILTGSGNDVVSLNGGVTQGEITLGSGSDKFNWAQGEYAGGVTFAGNDGNDQATIGNVSIADTSHILSQGGTNSTLTFNGTHAAVAPGTANIGSLATDDLSKGTNIGTGWSTLTLNGAGTDVRVVDDLTLSGTPMINILNGAILRSGVSSTLSDEMTIHNYNVATSGSTSLLSFDGVTDPTYSGVISGTGGMEYIGGSELILLGANTYTGNTLIGTGSQLTLGNGGTQGSLSTQTNITDNGLLSINHSDDVALNGVISGTGAFSQIGTGVTRLGANNTYAGVTTVQLGTLLINGIQSGSGATSVQSGAALGGKGTIGGNVTFATGTTLTPGDNATGTLTINGDLVLASDTNSKFELGQAYTAGGALNDLVNVGGNLTLDGNLNATLSAGGDFLPGVYRLFNYGGTLTDNTMDIASLPPNDAQSYAIQTNLANQVNLVLNFVDPSGTLQFWDGDSNGTNHGADGVSGNGVVNGGFGYWVANIAGVSNNWTQATGNGNAPWAQDAFAIFQGSANEVRISNINGAVLTSGMQFTSDGYVLNADPLNPGSQLQFTNTNVALTPENNFTAQGETAADNFFVIRVGDGGAGADVTTTINVDLVQDASNTSVTRLLKTDPGRLILNGDNIITGGVEVWNGTLQVSKDSSLGDAGTSVTLRNHAALQAGADFITDRLIFLAGTDGGTLDTYGNTFTPTGVIGGTGALKIVDTSAGTNNSQLVLGTVNTYQGDTTLVGKNGTGTLSVNANTTGAFGTPDSHISLTDGVFLNFNNTAQAESHVLSVDGSTLNFNDTASAAQSTVVLTDNGSANFADNATAGSAAINVDATSLLSLADDASGGTSVTTNRGRVTFAGNAQAQNARIDNQAGGLVTLAASAGNTAIGSLSGAGDIHLGAATLTEGNLGLNDAISGVISGDNGSLVKTGNGTLTLTGANIYTGTTTASQGVLLINGNQSAATGAASVNSLATLGGNGTLGGSVTVADNGHLTPGADLNSVGVLTMGSLTLAGNAQLDFQFGQTYNPGGAFNDLINVNGDLNLDGKLNITQTAGGNFDVGLYRVINYTGALTNNILEIGTAPAAAEDLYVQTSIAGQVNLINRAGYTMRFWDGAGGSGGALKNNGIIDGGDGIWQNSHGNDNWTTDLTTPAGAFNTPFSDAAFAVFGGAAGNVTVDNSLGAVTISGAQFATHGYVINDGVITTNTADTLLRVGDGTAGGANYTATINSVINGSGGLNKSDLGTLILNGNNLYQGGTQVSGGVLQVSGDQNLGAADTAIGLNGGTLRYGAAFDTARKIQLSGSGGGIDTNGNAVSLLSAVSGSGNLTKLGEGTLTLTQNSTFDGQTTIGAGTLQLGTGATTGSVTGNIVDNGQLVLNRSNSLQLNGAISGTGDVIQRGTGTTVLNGSNTWSGITMVENGTLLAGSANSFSRQSSHVVSLNGTLDTGGQDQSVANVVNQGTINLRGGDVGSALTVNGNYVGMNGTLKLTAQPQDVGTSDKLVINNGSATGSTLLNIDVSRLGEPTTGDGIMVVAAQNGATTTAQTTKSAFTIGADNLLAGAWQYQLYAGNAQGAGEDWFLRAGYRPDVPGFISIPSVIRQADLFTLGTLHQRVGDEQPWQSTVPEDQEGRFWARYLVKTIDQHLDDPTHSQSHTQYSGMQVGVDVYHDDKWRSGVYTTVMDIDSSIDGHTGMGSGAAYNSTLSTYIGGYATWTDTSGLYVDNVLQYGYHSVDLKNSIDHETYHPNGNTVTASVEVGRPWQLGDSNWSLEPQAQLIYQWSNFDSVGLKDNANTQVDVNADDAVIGRLGARLAVDYDTQYGHIKPYVRANFWQQLADGQDETKYRNTASGAGQSTVQSNQKFSATEVAVGATWAFTHEVQAYTEVGKTWDSGGDTSIDANVAASVGVKIRF
ncbi:transporter [Serratia proteamaculans]|uniref:autotransporter-associated beta strand repeat-containing protein n=1 Tax=Serratia proteamaculans TaxID=28151 RepID=UPI001575EEB6|nr:autotransporter-associated beta strand repeat-containing protein [Serratia proteamaculans]NTX77434.1 transporter [Serratia proteamaculans]NTZ28323.1 transporter [Serratia proteamaculans]